MNTGFYDNLDTNFETALKMSEKDFLHDELIYMLQNGNIPEKQIAALKLETVNNITEAKILMQNLTKCDGKIREAVALKVNTILSDSSKIHFFFDYPDIFADATIDINANICRLVIDSVDMLKISQDFSDIYINKIINFTNEALIELDNFIFKDKKYIINKQLFKLYWTLEAIKLFSNKIPTEVLFPILEKAAKEREYTIREKVAQILINLNDSIYNEIKNSLKQDENYYVKLVFR